MADYRSQALRNLTQDPWNTVGGQGLLEAIRGLGQGAENLVQASPIGMVDRATGGGINRGMTRLVDILSGVGESYSPVARDTLDVASDLTGGYQVPEENDLRAYLGIAPQSSRADGLGPVPEEASVRAERQGRSITGPTGRSSSGLSDMYAVGPDDTYQNQLGNFSKIGTTGIAERGQFERKKQQLMEALALSAAEKPNEYTGDFLKNVEQYAGMMASSGNERGAIKSGFLKAPEQSAPPPEDGESVIPAALMALLAGKFGGKAIGMIPGPVGKIGRAFDEVLSVNTAKKMFGKGEKATSKAGGAIKNLVGKGKSNAINDAGAKVNLLKRKVADEKTKNAAAGLREKFKKGGAPEKKLNKKSLKQRQRDAGE